ncbi:AraC family transcriptional regulator [Neobacillus muris]|uniref:AraC family transcriptional regulator n=1 Tax=Neobacillus muris TaxID=2941334 RepID=UPI00203CCEDA|nr:AraC family transcriptional regulator [Neobacillus muris]
MQKNVEELLFNISLDEIDNLKNARKVTKVNKETYANIDRKMIIKKDYFLKNRKVYISKHSRFADFPEHSHNFLELNYMLSGTVTQVINGNEEVLHTGDILLMDKDAVHFVKAPGVNDLLINLMIPVENLDFESLTSIMNKNHFIFSFLLENNTCENHSTYVIFRSSKHVVIQQLLDQIIDKYYSNSPFANEIIRLNISILFMELLENVPYEVHGNTHQQTENNLAFEVLRIIHQEFRTITLSQLAKQLNYNKNYLSNLIKNKTGKSFKQLQTKERLERAKLLIENTDLTIEEVIYEVGWLNKSHFYRKYKEVYGEPAKNPKIKRQQQFM